MDVPKPDAPAQKAHVEIEIVPLGTAAPKIPEANPDDSTDRFLKEATLQYGEGHLDQPLWDRAFAQAKGDKEAAVDTYLHARAIALRLLDRERRTQMRTNVAANVPRRSSTKSRSWRPSTSIRLSALRTEARLPATARSS